MCVPSKSLNYIFYYLWFDWMFKKIIYLLNVPEQVTLVILFYTVLPNFDDLIILLNERFKNRKLTISFYNNHEFF